MLFDYNIDFLEDKLQLDDNYDDKIYNYKGTRNESEYDRMFKLYQNHLNYPDYEIPQAYFYFKDNDAVDAGAGKRLFTETPFIFINKGLIETVHKLYNQLKLSNFPEYKHYSDFEEKFSISIFDIMYRCTTHFTFFHELGHLVQNIEVKNFSFDEKIKEDVKDSFVSHVKEADADIFACGYICPQLEQFVKNYLPIISYKDIIMLSSIAATSIYLLFSIFSDHDADFYIKQKKHPHPFCRLVYIIIIISEDLSDRLNKATHGIIKPNSEEIRAETIKLSSSLCQRIIGIGNFKKYLKVMEESQNREDETQTYIRELLPTIEANPKSAYNHIKV